jgi:hypothetical protein
MKSRKPEFAPTSTDLKSATDRIPVEVSAKVLSKIWGDEDLSKS